MLSVTMGCPLPCMTETMTIMTWTAPCGQMEAGGTVFVRIAVWMDCMVTTDMDRVSTGKTGGHENTLWNLLSWKSENRNDYDELLYVLVFLYFKEPPECCLAKTLGESMLNVKMFLKLLIRFYVLTALILIHWWLKLCKIFINFVFVFER